VNRASDGNQRLVLRKKKALKHFLLDLLLRLSMTALFYISMYLLNTLLLTFMLNYLSLHKSSAFVLASTAIFSVVLFSVFSVFLALKTYKNLNKKIANFDTGFFASDSTDYKKTSRMFGGQAFFFLLSCAWLLFDLFWPMPVGIRSFELLITVPIVFFTLHMMIKFYAVTMKAIYAPNFDEFIEEKKPSNDLNALILKNFLDQPEQAKQSIFDQGSATEALRFIHVIYRALGIRVTALEHPNEQLPDAVENEKLYGDGFKKYFPWHNSWEPLSPIFHNNQPKAWLKGYDSSLITWLTDLIEEKKEEPVESFKGDQSDFLNKIFKESSLFCPYLLRMPVCPITVSYSGTDHEHTFDAMQLKSWIDFCELQASKANRDDRMMLAFDSMSGRFHSSANISYGFPKTKIEAAIQAVDQAFEDKSTPFESGSDQEKIIAKQAIVDRINRLPIATHDEKSFSPVHDLLTQEDAKHTAVLVSKYIKPIASIYKELSSYFEIQEKFTQLKEKFETMMSKEVVGTINPISLSSLTPEILENAHKAVKASRLNEPSNLDAAHHSFVRSDGPKITELAYFMKKNEFIPLT
jgi:hypothetical protein